MGQANDGPLLVLSGSSVLPSSTKKNTKKAKKQNKKKRQKLSGSQHDILQVV